MLSDYFNCFKSPLQIATDTQNYTIDGLIIWKNLSFPKMKFVYRDYGENDAMINDALKDPNKAVMLQVNNGQHWVVAIRKTLFGKDYVCVDPWDGKKCLAKKKYHNITGSARFCKI